MTDQRKTKVQLLAELAALRRRVAELEGRAAGAEDQSAARTSGLIELDQVSQQSADDALRDSEERYRNLVELSPDGIVVHQNNRFVFVNPAGLASLGAASLEEVVGQSVLERIHPDYRAKAVARARQLMTNDPALIYPIEDVYLKMDGTPFPVEVMATLTTYQGQPAVQVVVRDISKRQQVEALLAAQRDLARIMTAANTAQAAWPQCLEIARRVSALDCGGLYLLRADEQVLELVCHQGLGAEFVAQSSRYPIESRNVQILLQGQTRYFSAADLVEQGLFEQEGLRALAVIPIQHQGRTLGAINIASHCLTQVPDHARRALETIAAEIGNIVVYLRTETALRESEEKYRSLIDSQESAISTIDADGVFHYMNWQGAAAFSVSPDAVVGRKLHDFFPAHIADWQLNQVRTVIATGQGQVAEYETRLAGQPNWRHVSIQPVRDAAGRVTLAMVNSQDITDRKLAEDKAHASHERFDAVFYNAPLEGIIYRLIRDAQGEIVDWEISDVNPLGAASIGQRPDDLIGRRTLDLFGPETMQPYLELSRLVAATGEPRLFETHFQANERDYMSSVFMVGTDHYANISVDITDSKRADKARRESDQQYRLLYETMEQGVIFRSTNGQVIDANPAAERILGVSLSQLQALTQLDPRWQIIREDGTALLDEDQPFWVALQTGQPVHDRVMGVFNPREAAYRWLKVNAAPRFKPGAAEPYQVYTTLDDITDRKRFETNLRQSEARAQAMLKAIPDLMFRLDRQGVFLDYKADIRDLYAQHEPTLIGKRNRDIAPVEFADLIDQQIETAFATGLLQTFEYQLDIPGQGVRDYEARLTPSGSAEVLAVVRDITERKRAEAALRASEEKYRSLLESLDSVVATIDADGRFLYMNEVAARQLGGTPDRFIGCTMAELFPEPVAAIQLRAVQQVILNDQPYVNQTESIVQGQRRWYRTSVQPIHDETGRAVQALLNTTDITPLVEAQRQLEEINRTLEERVAQRTRELASANERLTELDRLKSKFVSDVSHELRTPVTSLSLYIDLLERGKPEKREQYVGQTERSNGAAAQTHQRYSGPVPVGARSG